jgi:hypothetical protein
METAGYLMATNETGAFPAAQSRGGLCNKEKSAALIARMPLTLRRVKINR